MPPPLENAFAKAAANGHVRVIQALLNAGVLIDTPGKGLGTAVCEAARNNRLAAVEVLVECGADINRQENGWLPLYVAAKRGHLEVLEALLSHGAEPNRHCEGGWKRGGEDPGTALFVALLNGHMAVAEALRRAGGVEQLLPDEVAGLGLHEAAHEVSGGSRGGWCGRWCWWCQSCCERGWRRLSGHVVGDVRA